MEKRICKFCNKDVLFVKHDTFNLNLKYNRRYFCDKDCYTSFVNAPEQRIKYYKSFLKNRGVEIPDGLEFGELKELFHSNFSDMVKVSQPKRVKTLYEKDKDWFSKNSKSGNFNRKIKFLKKEGLYFEGIDENQVDSLYKKYFNEITNHSDKVLEGFIKKTRKFRKFKKI